MDRRKFLIGAGSTAIGGSALLGSGAFTRVESQRSVTVSVAEDPDAYLGLGKCDTLNGSYAHLDSQGHLRLYLDDENPTIGDTPLGLGINSNSTSGFDNVFQVCNQGKKPVCVHVEDSDAWPETDDGDRRVEFYLGDDDSDSIIGEANAFALDVGQCACVGVKTRSYGLAEGDELLDALDNEVRLIADVDGDCFARTEIEECVECTVEEGDGSEDFLFIEDLDTTGYPEVKATVRVDTDSGRDGDLDESNVAVCETFDGDYDGQTPAVTFAGEDESAEADVMLVIDTSGSMGTTKMEDAKDGAKTLVDTLGPGVNVGLVEFNSNATLVQGLTSDMAAVKSAIDGLTSGGGTNMGSGIDEAQDEFDANGRTGVPKFMVVLGDGDTSGGEIPATNAKNAGTVIYGIAYGSGADPQDFEDIVGTVPNDPDWADYAFDADQDDITEIFEDIGAIISGTYRITYTTCNPATDGSTRDVLVYVDDPVEGDADEVGTYTAPSS